MTPKAMKNILNDLDIAEKYDFSRPVRQRDIVPVESYDAVQRVMQNDGGEFCSAYGEKARALVPGPG
jgi:linoleate 10R-lipoxygenase